MMMKMKMKHICLYSTINWILAPKNFIFLILIVTTCTTTTTTTVTAFTVMTPRENVMFQSSLIYKHNHNMPYFSEKKKFMRWNQNQKTHYLTNNTKRYIGPQQLGEFEVLHLTQPSKERRVQFFDFATSGELVVFEEAWDFQKKLLNDHVQRLSTLTDRSNTSKSHSSGSSSSNSNNNNNNNMSGQFIGDGLEEYQSGLDTVIMLQHHPVYTLGTGSDEEFILSRDKNIPVVRMDRGGEVHCHCPGQLTMYGIFDLRGYRQDIHWYMRALEEAVILALAKCGLDRAERQDDITGVWIDNCKVAAVGIKCRKWITMHGLSVNIERDSVGNFSGIVPCGLVDRDVGCLNQFLKEPITVAEFSILLQETLEEVFQIELVKSKNESFSELYKKSLS